MRRRVTPRSKYGNRKTVVDGVIFDSASEARHYQMLKLAVKAGMIRDLTLQPEFELIGAFRDNEGKAHRKTVYRADFSYWDVVAKERVVCDVKGVKTGIYKIKEKLFLSRYPGIKFMVVPA